jgi:DNA-binding transcriptional MerR regulator
MLDARQIAEIVRTHDRDGEVSPSTLHYYVQVGILPPAVGRGRSGYTPEHLTRFRLARHLKHQGVGLAEIRVRLGRMTSEQVATELASLQAGGLHPRRLRAEGPSLLSEPAAAGSDETVSRYGITAEALRARGGDTPRTLRFRGGFSLQVPQGTSDEQIARLYTAIEAVLTEEDAT